MLQQGRQQVGPAKLPRRPQGTGAERRILVVHRPVQRLARIDPLHRAGRDAEPSQKGRAAVQQREPGALERRAPDPAERRDEAALGLRVRLGDGKDGVDLHLVPLLQCQHGRREELSRPLIALCLL